MRALMVFLVGLSAWGFGIAQDLPGRSTQKTQAELDEVSVEGRRLFELRAAIVESQDRFYALYNDLNDQDEFDIVCGELLPTGTKLVRRACFPQVVHTATEEEALAIWFAMFMGGAARPQVTPPNTVLAGKVQDYRKNMLKVLRRNPKLRALANESEDLQRKYDEAQKERMKGRLAIIE